MDFVAAWKAISIVVTGAFGVLGLLTEFKDKATNRITRWGQISLSGIIISTLLGTAAQIKENNDSATKAIKLATQSEQTLRDINRSLERIDQPTVFIQFSGSCGDKDFISICQQVQKIPPVNSPLSKVTWHLAFNHDDDDLEFHIDIWDSEDSIRQQRVTDHFKRASLVIYPKDDSLHSTQLKSVSYNAQDDTLRITVLDRSPWLLANDDTVLSTPDLIGKVAVITGSLNNRRRLTPIEFTVRMSNGASIHGYEFHVLSLDGYDYNVCKLGR